MVVKRSEKAIPAMPFLRCNACGCRMDPGYPIGTPEPQNVTVCPGCEAEYLFGVDLEVRVLDEAELAKLPPEARAHAPRMIDLVRACQGKKPKAR